MDNKRLVQLKEAWIRNVMKIMKLDKDEVEKLYDKIQPYTSNNVLEEKTK